MKYSKRLFVLFLILLLLSIFVMRYLDSYLITTASPNGIVSFELAKDVKLSADMIEAWDAKAKTAAGISMGFDFLFLIIYASFISLLINGVNKKIFLKKNFSILEKVVFLPFLAAFFDVVENIALVKLLLGDLQMKWSLIAYYAAVIKFGLLLIAIVYILIGGVILVSKKLIKLK